MEKNIGRTFAAAVSAVLIITMLTGCGTGDAGSPSAIKETAQESETGSSESSGSGGSTAANAGDSTEASSAADEQNEEPALNSGEADMTADVAAAYTMKDAADAILETMYTLNEDYSPEDPEFYWTAVYRMVNNYSPDTYGEISSQTDASNVEDYAEMLFPDNEMPDIPEDMSDTIRKTGDTYEFEGTDDPQYYVYVDYISGFSDGTRIMTASLGSYSDLGESYADSATLLSADFSLKPDLHTAPVAASYLDTYYYRIDDADKFSGDITEYRYQASQDRTIFTEGSDFVDSDNYDIYTNDRFGFTSPYPKTFKKSDSEPENGDGQTFTDKYGATLTISAGYKVLDEQNDGYSYLEWLGKNNRYDISSGTDGSEVWTCRNSTDKKGFREYTYYYIGDDTIVDFQLVYDPEAYDGYSNNIEELKRYFNEGRTMGQVNTDS